MGEACIRGKLGHVVLADLADEALQLLGLLELAAVGLALEGGGGREHDILGLARDGVLPVGEPGDLVLVNDAAPLMAGDGARRDGRLLVEVEDDILGHDAGLGEGKG